MELVRNSSLQMEICVSGTCTLASSAATLTKSVKNSLGRDWPSPQVVSENLAMMSHDKSMAHCSMFAKE
jgi:hypothetical protein